MSGLQIIIGNICSLCAMAADSISGTRRKNSEILGIQIISQFFFAAASAVLNAYSSVVQNAVAVLRNLAAIKDIKSRALEWTLIARGVILGIAFNNRGLIGWLPVVANFEYSVSVFRFRDRQTALKYAFIVNMLMYFAFDIRILNFVGAAGNIVVAVTTFISIMKTKKEAKAERE